MLKVLHVEVKRKAGYVGRYRCRGESGMHKHEPIHDQLRGFRADIVQAAGVAAGLAETVVHPMDTIICRLQSGNALQFSKLNGLFNKTFHSGLYQGFGPTVIASIPASIAFFTVYESVKVIFANARVAGHLQAIPESVDYATGSAVAELLACAIINPAQVLKQNAQVFQRSGRLKISPTAEILKRFVKHPSKLWTGYTVLVAAQLPCVCLTFSIYESLKKELLSRRGWEAGDPLQHIQASALCAAVAGCCSSWAFVPADVVRIRMRLTVGRGIESKPLQSTTMVTAGMASQKSPLAGPKALAIAREKVRQEGFMALFRGSTLSCVAAGVGSAIYLGCYEGMKIYCDEAQRTLES